MVLTQWLLGWQMVFSELSVHIVCVMFLQAGVASHNENMQYLNLALKAANRQRGLCHSRLTQDQRDTRPVKRDSRGDIRKNSKLVQDFVPYSVPFGPHLTPVPCQRELSPQTRRVTTADLEVSSDNAQRTKPAPAFSRHQGKYECNPASTQCDCTDVMSENSDDLKEPIHTTITTNDLLDCLVHPDIISRVTRLLLERHTGNHRTDTQS